MKKFLAIILLFGATFGAGFYMGRLPPQEVKRQFQELSQEVVEQTIGMEEEELHAMAMSGFLKGKSKILEGKPEEAIAELDATADYLERSVNMNGGEASDALLESISKIAGLRRSLAEGQPVSREALAEAQKKLEALLLEA